MGAALLWRSRSERCPDSGAESEKKAMTQ